MKNYFEEFYKRYETLKSVLEIKDINALKPEAVKSILNNESKNPSDQKNAQTLNNLVMAGLGMGTLYLRMGAVLMIAEKTKPDAEKDVSFLKLIAEKLIHKLPADGEWKDIWQAYLSKDNKSEWNKIVDSAPLITGTEGKIYEAFVAFRNNIVHQDVIITSILSDAEIEKTIKGLKILEAMSRFRECFAASIISLENNEVYFQYQSDTEKLKISPYVQINKDKKPETEVILPYLFQGRYYKGAKFINTDGEETKEEKDDTIDDTFNTISKEIQQFNGDKAFEFDEKIKNYNEWCIGRDEEVNAIMEWINKSDTDKNVLPIFAPAGLGKGALVAEVIKNLKDKKLNHLYHFCGSGNANNLQAILYSLIIQGGWDKDINEIIKTPAKSIWNVKNLPPKFQNRFARFPTQYIDVIELFQTLMQSENETSENEISNAIKNPNPDARFNAIYDVLKKIVKKNDKNQLDELLNQYYITAKQLIDSRGNKLQTEYYHYIFDIHFSLTKFGLKSDLLDLVPENHRILSKKYLQPIVIIIDGLDEAAVSEPSKRISDWFYTYNEKGERAEKWLSPNHIKWIFTYRLSGEKDKKGYQFESYEFNTFPLALVQPLEGLSPKAVKNGLQIEFEKLEPALTDDFLETIIIKGSVK